MANQRASFEHQLDTFELRPIARDEPFGTMSFDEV